MASKQKMQKPSPKQEIDKLIDWYQANKPQAGGCIPVALSPGQLAKALGLAVGADKTVRYRDRVLMAMSAEGAKRGEAYR